MADPKETLIEAVEDKLSIDDLLVAAQEPPELGGFSNDQVAQELTEAYDYVQQDPPANDDEAQLRAVIIAELHGEIEVVKRLDGTAMAPADQWPRQREAIRRAYYFGQSNAIAFDAAAKLSQSRADLVNGMVDSAKKTAGEAGKGLFEGLEGVVGLLVVLVVVLAIANFAGGRT